MSTGSIILGVTLSDKIKTDFFVAFTELEEEQTQ